MTRVHGPDPADKIGHRQSDQLAPWLPSRGIIMIFNNIN